MVESDGTTPIGEQLEATKELGEASAATTEQLESLAASNTKVAETSESATSASKNLKEEVIDIGDASGFAGKMLAESNEQLSKLSSISNTAGDVLHGVTSRIGSLVSELNELNNLSGAQQKAFTMLNVAAVGVKTSFDNIGNIDTTGLTLFREEASELVSKVQHDILSGGIDKALGGISNVFGKVIGAQAKEAAKAGSSALVGFIEKLVQGTDNVRRLTNVQMQLAASTGNLAELQDAAGPGFVDLNTLINEQHASLTNLGVAYGVSNNVLEQYYATMGKIPGGLTEQVSGYDSATSKVSALNGAMLLASGTGRSFADVTNDMHEAIRNYGANSDQALTFTSRISEITNNYGLELKDVRSRLLDVAQGFRFFGNEAEGAAKLVNHYVNAIKDTGVSGNVALEVVGQMTDGIKGLTLSQKAFISAQTGGAGGLMGAFQIEKELREGNIDKVFEKVRDTMKQQMGEIVSLEEASVSQEAAARLTKQMQILKQGPLGQFAKDDQSAIRILEGFKKADTGETIIKTLAETEEDGTNEVRNNLMSAGNVILQRNNDAITQLNRTIERQQQLNDAGAYELTQRGLGSVAVSREQTPEEMRRITSQRELTEIARNRATEQGANVTESILEGAPVQERSGKRMVESTRDLVTFGTDVVPKVASSMMAVAKDIVGELKDSIPEMNQEHSALRLAENATVAGLSTDQVTSLMASAAKGNEDSSQTLSNLAAGSQNDRLTNEQIKSAQANITVPGIISGEMVASQLPQLDPANIIEGLRASTEASVATQIGAKEEAEVPGPGVQQVINQDNGVVTVKVEGICIECGKKAHSQHARTHGVPTG